VGVYLVLGVQTLNRLLQHLYHESAIKKKKILSRVGDSDWPDSQTGSVAAAVEECIRVF